MKLISILIMSLLCAINLFAQNNSGNVTGATSESNLKAVQNLSPFSSAVGFDARYQGVKGTTRLFDTLVPSTIIINGQEEHFRMASDIDVVRNALLFRKTDSGELMEIPSGNIAELIFHLDGKDILYKTTEGLVLDKKPEGIKFYQMLKEGPWQFIRIPDKKFVEADYQRVYGPDRRYDEYKPLDNYYIQGSDSVFHRVQLTRKSLRKLFPDRKDLIDNNFNEKSTSDPEADIISLLGKF